MVSKVFLDTSVLVGGLIDLGEASSPAQRLMTGVAEGRLRETLTAWHCCLEFYSVATRLPAEFRLAPHEALVLIEEEILARIEIRQLPEKGWRPFLRSAQQERVAGGRIYDAHVAEVARLAGARVVVTDNRRHFTSLLRYGIEVLTAAELAEERGL